MQITKIIKNLPTTVSLQLRFLFLLTSYHISTAALKFVINITLVICAEVLRGNLCCIYSHCRSGDQNKGRDGINKVHLSDSKALF